MRRLELGVGRYLGAHLAGKRSVGTGAQLGRRIAIDAHLAAHARLPMWQGELELTQQLKRAQDRVYTDVDRVVADVDAGRIDQARATIIGPMTADGDEVDRLLTRLININTDKAASAARNIAALRQRASALAIILDTVSVLLGVVLVLAAVRAARLYHRALVEQRRLAEARASELDHFAARVAHDLKAPLASVVLGTTVAAEYPSETRKALEKVLRTSRLMSDMIDALLNVARVEPQQVRARTAIAPVLEVIVDEVRPAAIAAEAVVHLEEIPPRAAVACSSGVLASVVSNLLQNAVKYIKGARGERRIAVSVCERGKCVCIEVKDTGPGLPKELESHVFERYVRGAGSTGLGLGLATVKHLVESVGGRLGVESKPGEGSCFWVELPRASTHEARAAV